MSEKQTRGTAALAILQLLKRHTDENHTLSQNKIKELLSSEYDINVDRKTISRNLSRLIEYGFPIQFQGKDIPEDEIIRKGKNGEEELIMTNWYYDHAFTKGELRLLIDNVMFTSALTKRYRKELITKLERLSSKYFSFEMPKIDMEIDNRIQNNDIIMTYENIGYAIANGKQLGFFYCDYKTDGKLHPRTQTDDFKKQYIVNPYQILSMNGHPYLICNMPQYDDLTHFRLDRIKDSRVMDTPAKPLRRLRGFETGMRLSEYLAEHPNLWSGESVYVTLQCNQNMLNDVVDSFGTNVRIVPLSNDRIKVHVRASEHAMFHWAIQFAEAVEVISPESLRLRITNTLREALKKYERET